MHMINICIYTHVYTSHTSYTYIYMKERMKMGDGKQSLRPFNPQATLTF